MINAQQLAAALRAAANSLDGNAPGAGAPQTQLAAAALVSPPPPPAAQTLPDVTADQLTSLIMPHISNEAVKTALGVAMRENGVANLPEAQPHQYPALYAAFQRVLAQFGIGGSVTNAATPAPAASII